MSGPEAEPNPEQVGQAGILACVLLFSTVLGVTAVALPLQALAAGYGVAEVGYLGGLGAAAQIAARSALPWVLRSVPDRWLIRVACGLMGASGLILGFSTGPAAFVISASVLGVARALFWTGSQVYVLRGDLRTGQRRLSYLQFTSATGEFLGPLAGGFLAQWTVDAAVWLWAVCGLAGLVPAAFLTRFRPLGRVDRHRAASVWRQRDVLVGCAAVGTAGGWRGLLSSLVPAVLAEMGRSAGQIGALVALGNATSMGGSLAAGRLPRRWIGATLSLSIIATGLSVAALGMLAGSVVVAGLTLAVSGFACGLLQTLGTVLAAGTVPDAQRGEVVVLTGLVRSVALMALPAGVGALVGAMTAPVALAVGGGLLAAPAAVRWRRRR